jgi:hypothetical protein
MTIATLRAATDAANRRSADRRKLRENADPRLQMAVDELSRNWLLRAVGPALHVHGYDDGRGGCVVVLRADPLDVLRVPSSWIATVAASIEAETGLLARRFALAEDRGLLCLSFMPRRGSVPGDLHGARYRAGKRTELGTAA